MKACTDGFDNDGDGYADYPGIAGIGDGWADCSCTPNP